MRIAGNLDLDGQTVKLDQGGNSTTITSNSPSSDITLTLPKDADGILVNCEHGGDATKEVTFDSSGATTAKEMTIASSHTDDRTLTMPDATDTLVGRATTDTLTNKTLTSPTVNTPTLTVNDDSLTIQDNADTSKKLNLQLSGITTSTTRTLTVPDANTTIVGTDATQTLTNKTLTTPTVTVNDNAWTMQDNSDTSKKLNLQLSGITTSTTRTLTVPDANTTIVGTDATQTLTNKTLTSPVLTTPTMTAGSNLTLTQQAELRLEDDSGGEYVALVASTGTTTHTYNMPTAQGAANTALCNDGSGNLSWANALTDALNENAIRIGNSSNSATSTDTASQGDILADDVTGLTIKSGVIVNADVNASAAIAYSKLNLASSVVSADLADISGTVVGTSDTQTLTNKTLTTPIISSISNTGTLTLPTSTDTLVGRATTDTLTNKTLSDSTTVFGNVSDVTKSVGLSIGPANTGTTTTLQFQQTGNRVITFPDTTDTIVCTATNDTLTNKTISSPIMSGTISMSSTPTVSGAVTFAGGALIMNGNGEDYDTRIQGDTDANLLKVDAGLDRVGVGVATPLAKLQVTESGAATTGLTVLASSSAYTANALVVNSNTTAGSGYHFLFCQSDVDGTPDTEFRLRGDGEAFADGSWTGSGADYAEYIESVGGEVLEVGEPVVLEGDKVRVYNSASDSVEDIMGVVRPKEWAGLGPVVKGNSAWNMWSGKYLMDDWGVYIQESYDLIEWMEDGKEVSYHTDFIPEGVTPPQDATITENAGTRRKLNPSWDPNTEYQNRAERPEWQLIGMIGQVPMKENSAVNPRWRKMKLANNGVEWWFIR